MPNDTSYAHLEVAIVLRNQPLTDHIQAAVLDLMAVTGDDVTRVIMQFSGGTQIVDLRVVGCLLDAHPNSFGEGR